MTFIDLLAKWYKTHDGRAREPIDLPSFIIVVIQKSKNRRSTKGLRLRLTTVERYYPISLLS